MDGVHRKRSLHAHERPDAGVASLELHGGQSVGDGVGARAAVALQVHAEHAELSELACELARGDGARLEPVGNLRLDPALDEVTDDVADRSLLFGEHAVDGEELKGLTRGAAHGSSEGSCRTSRWDQYPAGPGVRPFGLVAGILGPRSLP